jgi:hypothetical protein
LSANNITTCKDVRLRSVLHGIWVDFCFSIGFSNQLFDRILIILRTKSSDNIVSLDV